MGHYSYVGLPAGSLWIFDMAIETMAFDLVRGFMMKSRFGQRWFSSYASLKTKRYHLWPDIYPPVIEHDDPAKANRGSEDEFPLKMAILNVYANLGRARDVWCSMAAVESYNNTNKTMKPQRWGHSAISWLMFTHS